MKREKIYGPGEAKAEQNTGDIGLFLLFPGFFLSSEMIFNCICSANDLVVGIPAKKNGAEMNSFLFLFLFSSL